MSENNKDNHLVVTQYRDPITSERKTVTTCPEHTNRMLTVLRHAGLGCVSTWSPSIHCDPCKNEGVEMTDVDSDIIEEPPAGSQVTVNRADLRRAVEDCEAAMEDHEFIPSDVYKSSIKRLREALESGGRG